MEIGQEQPSLKKTRKEWGNTLSGFKKAIQFFSCIVDYKFENELEDDTIAYKRMDEVYVSIVDNV